MKYHFLYLIVFLSVQRIWSQPLTVEDKLHINAGIGLSGYGLPFYGGADYGVAKNVSIGGIMSFSNYSTTYSNNPYSATILALGGRINYHFNSLFNLESNQWDIYGGGTLAYFVWNWNTIYPNSKSSGAGLYGQIGGRYYFDSKWAANMEIGGGYLNGIKLGITYRL